MCSQTSWNNNTLHVIEKLTLKNFRNFSDEEFLFSSWKNIIIWKNGHWKTNILEALALPLHSLVESLPQYLLQRGTSHLFISYQLSDGNYNFSYQWEDNKKKFLTNGRSISKNTLQKHYPHVVSFHPLMMNMMYLWPSERRFFLDNVLCQSSSVYQQSLSKFKKILSSRNKILKRVFEKKSDPQELNFWNEEFIKYATLIYKERAELIKFLSSHIQELQKYFFGKVNQVTFSYQTKVDLESIELSLRTYLDKNLEKEILVRRTIIGPHLDDFDILIDEIPLIHFASRWEVKSSLIALKFLETHFLERYSEKSDILFLIDDLLSELDTEHRDMIWSHIGKRQSFITAIEDSLWDGNKIYI